MQIHIYHTDTQEMLTHLLIETIQARIQCYPQIGMIYLAFLLPGI